MVKKFSQLLALVFVLAFLGISLKVVAYKWIPVSNTPYMRAMAHKAGVSQIKQSWVPLSSISAQLPLAVVSSEDNLFVKHNGFSWTAIKRACLSGKGGGSTISQQTAKNVFLWNGHSYVRKVIEVLITAEIELFWGKRRIMEVYLNVIEQGPGVFGAEASAQAYFHHSAKSLSRNEAALMAVVLPNPIRMKISNPSSYVRMRQSQIASLMPKIGKVKYPD